MCPDAALDEGVREQVCQAMNRPEYYSDPNQLNTEVLNRLLRSGEALVSNAVVGGTFLLRACVVNFRTSLEDIEAVPGIVIHIGREVDAALRPIELTSE